MMHILGRLSRVVMACALSVLFLGGTGKTILAAPAISFTDIAGREVQLDKCELSRNMRIYVTRNENVPRHFFALAHFLSAFFGGAWRRVKTDTIHPLFLRKWGRFHRHQEYSLGLLRFPPAFYGLLRQATWLYTHYWGYTPCFWTTSFDSFFAARAAVSLARLMS